MTAFLVPALLILAAEGVERARTSVPRLARIGAAVAAVAAGCLFWGVAGYPPPYMEEHVRPALERLRAEWKSGDALYVYYGVRLPYVFYAPVLDLPPREAVLGECARDYPRRYLSSSMRCAVGHACGSSSPTTCRSLPKDPSCSAISTGSAAPSNAPTSAPTEASLR